MTGGRYTALDSWRGIAACMVALFHLRAPSHISEIDLLRHGYLGVDFFFVLSGFVIAANYQERLANGFGIGRFMLLRFGRLYPLHLFTLLLFVGYELARKPLADLLGPLVTRLLLVHGLGPFETRLWNIPSWSISTEFFAYLAFALAVVAWPNRIRVACIAVALACPLTIYLAKGTFNDADGTEMLRCLYGFSLGVLTWHAVRALRERTPGGTAAEVLVAAAMVAYLSVAGQGAMTLLAPVVFALVVLVFAAQRGALSKLLALPLFLHLGVISYSIYMIHFLVARSMPDLLVFARSLGVTALDRLGSDKWVGDAVILGYLALVVALSSVTYRLVEAPARDWFRLRAASRDGRMPRPA